MSRALVLLAHGSRDPRWRQPFEALQRGLARGDEGLHPVELAYLQFCEPTLDQVLCRCQAAGHGEALVVPLFMSGGGHVLNDVPGAVREAGKRAGVQVQVCGAVGEEPEVLAAMAAAIRRLGAG